MPSANGKTDMTRINEVLVYSVIFLFSMIVLGSCNSLDDMMDKYDEEYLRTVTGPEQEPVDPSGYEYVPGVYELRALIPNAEYTVDLGKTRQIQAKKDLMNYSWWVQSATGALLASAEFDEEGERVFYGGISAQSNYINILASLSSQLTTEYRTETGLTEEQKAIRRNTAHIVRCHAFNEYGDEYWDTALLYVIPAPDEEEEEE